MARSRGTYYPQEVEITIGRPTSAYGSELPTFAPLTFRELGPGEYVTRAAVAWVEIHGAKLHCTCGHVTDYTDHVRSEFCAHPEHACGGCGKRWGTPASAECEVLAAAEKGGE